MSLFGNNGINVKEMSTGDFAKIQYQAGFYSGDIFDIQERSTKEGIPVGIAILLDNIVDHNNNKNFILTTTNEEQDNIEWFVAYKKKDGDKYVDIVTKTGKRMGDITIANICNAVGFDGIFNDDNKDCILGTTISFKITNEGYFNAEIEVSHTNHLAENKAVIKKWIEKNNKQS